MSLRTYMQSVWCTPACITGGGGVTNNGVSPNGSKWPTLSIWILWLSAWSQWLLNKFGSTRLLSNLEHLSNRPSLKTGICWLTIRYQHDICENNAQLLDKIRCLCVDYDPGSGGGQQLLGVTGQGNSRILRVLGNSVWYNRPQNTEI